MWGGYEDLYELVGNMEEKNQLKVAALVSFSTVFYRFYRQEGICTLLVAAKRSVTSTHYYLASGQQLVGDPPSSPIRREESRSAYEYEYMLQQAPDSLPYVSKLRSFIPTCPLARLSHSNHTIVKKKKPKLNTVLYNSIIL